MQCSQILQTRIDPLDMRAPRTCWLLLLFTSSSCCCCARAVDDRIFSPKQWRQAGGSRSSLLDSMSVMQQLNFVSLLLLLGLMLAALSPFVVTARREWPTARNGEEGDHGGQAKLDQAVDVVSVSRSRPGTAAKAADHEEQQAVMRIKKGRKSCNFRTRNLPADGKTHFDGHIPFTADYHSVHRHPPKHN
ncbi:hypothetical protein GUJ93_ZPchr0006g46302 [Zizania palustris]|uniref:Uncharacterized protein n=1 Tax=Zizania palustris TaxID=103762 RepID=A0A8J5SDU3_ZIZPA|nr:hypothetical protein GUJ93_ZPchr0006g46302 [Zizania palustris]